MQLFKALLQGKETHFTGPLVVCPIAADEWVLIEPFGFRHRKGEEDEVIYTVPAGFTTDFASIPAIVWPILPKWEKYGWAAVIHDWLYWRQDSAGVTRIEADQIFRRAMIVCQVPSWKVKSIYFAVRHLGGGRAWRKNARERAKGRDRVVGRPGAPFALKLKGK
jgi:hypothetical protein